MSATRYVLVNDPHLSDQPPSSCTPGYQDDMFDLLGHVGAHAAAIHAAAVVFSGDIFHIKTPNRTSHRSVIRLIDTLRRYPCPTLIVPGNHDLLHDRLDSLDETQPLGVVFASGVAHRLDRWSAFDAGIIAHPVYGVPWLDTFTDDTVRDALAPWRDRPARAEAGLVVAHAPLYPPGQELPYENYPTYSWASCMDTGTCHYGHVHEPHGCYTVDGVTFSNPGALSRGSLHEHNLTRPVAVAVWDAATGTITHHELPHKPAAEVFRLAEVAADKAARVDLADFVATVTGTRLDITSIESVIAHVRGLDLDADLTDLVVTLLTEQVTT